MEKPLEFDEVINGMRVTVGYDGRRLKTAPMEAPYDSAERQFAGGRDIESQPDDDNALVRFALGLPPAKCTDTEYQELMNKAIGIRGEIASLHERLRRLDLEIAQLRQSRQS